MKSPGVAEVRRRLEHGLVPAVPVPFTAAGEIDAAAESRYVAFMAKQPIAGVAVWAHTGRGLHLSRTKRREVLERWAKRLPGEKLIVAGAGGLPERCEDWEGYVASAVEMGRDALAGGAHALLAYPPRTALGTKNSAELILDYHRRLASLGAPLILFYLYEAAGGVSYSREALRELFRLPQVAGIKLATLDSVMTFQDVARLTAQEFPRQLLITGEDRFFGYSLMCGARAALVGMGAVRTRLQARMMKAFFDGRSKEFLKLSRSVDRLSQALFVAPMEGYIRRVLHALAATGVIPAASAHDPWGPDLPDNELAELKKTLRTIGD